MRCGEIFSNRSARVKLNQQSRKTTRKKSNSVLKRNKMKEERKKLSSYVQTQIDVPFGGIFHVKKSISSGGARNSMELVKLRVQSGATGRQSVDESPWRVGRRVPGRKNRRAPPGDQRCVSASRSARTRCFWSIVSYLFIFHRTAAPGAISCFSFASCEEKIWNSRRRPPNPGSPRHSINFSRCTTEEKSLSRLVNRLSDPAKRELARIRSETRR